MNTLPSIPALPMPAEINSMPSQTRARLGLSEPEQCQPPMLGMFALYAFGVASGFGIAMLAFTFAF